MSATRFVETSELLRLLESVLVITQELRITLLGDATAFSF